MMPIPQPANVPIADLIAHDSITGLKASNGGCGYDAVPGMIDRIAAKDARGACFQK
jgi:hypothetical protein